MYKRVVIGSSVLALVVLAALGGIAAWRFLDRTPYEQAVAAMPQETLRATYTDWSQVRSLTGGAALDGGSSSGAVQKFLDRGYDADLISTSAISAATVALGEKYGFSPADVSWEMYGQSREGAVDVLRVENSVDLAAVQDNLRELGYTEPSSSGGVWAGTVDLVAQIDPSLSAVMQNVVVLVDEGLVLMSDDAAYASQTADVVQGDGSSLASGSGASDLAALSEEPVSSVLFASDFACEALSMSSADEEDQRVADEMVTAAGEIAPLSGLVMTHERDRSLVVGMQFETSDQAEENLKSRVELASGDAVGQGGTFPERFRISSARTEGETAVLTLEPTGERAESALLSDLSQGPVLFATC